MPSREKLRFESFPEIVNGQEDICYLPLVVGERAVRYLSHSQLSNLWSTPEKLHNHVITCTLRWNSCSSETLE